MKNENTIPIQRIAVRLYSGCVFCLVVEVVAFESTVRCSNLKKKKFTIFGASKLGIKTRANE